MKKGEQRNGNYVVTLHSDKKCIWCDRVLKAKTKALRYYHNGFSNYECYPQDDKCIKALEKLMSIS